jgi:uncharacterized cupin superfamily protein
MGVGEAPLRSTKYGLVADVDGWFVVNACEARWRDYGPLGKGCNFEGKRPFKQLGINVNVLAPGEPLGLYHRESHQEGFLVIAGECLLIVEGEERRLRAWDFFHSPPWTEHAFVGAGDGPCSILMVGAHGGPDVRYPVSELAGRYGASVEKETTDPGEVYATAERFRRQRPPYWDRLPWA